MLRLIGCVMVFGSCAALGLSARQELRRRIAAADAWLTALGILHSEIACRRTPLPDIADQLAENDDVVIRLVFTSLSRRLREESGLPFGSIWRACLRDSCARTGLGAEECRSLCQAAQYLGRYDAAEQLAGLEQTAQRLKAARAAAEERLRSRGGLYRTCGIAAGLLVILALL